VDAVQPMYDSDRMTNGKKVGSKVEERVGKAGDMRMEYPLGRPRIEENEAIRSLQLILDSYATCFVGISARRSVLSEAKTGREVLVTSGTGMCAKCRARGLAWCVRDLKMEEEGNVGEWGSSVKWKRGWEERLTTESLLAKSPSGFFRFWDGEAGRGAVWWHIR
jgi:hypothetical protein